MGLSMAETGGWFEWATGTSWDDASAAAREGVAQGVGSAIFGASTVGSIPSANERDAAAAAAAAAAAEGREYCDRTTILGRIGVCEAQQAYKGVAEIVSSPVFTLTAGALAVGAGTLAVVALANITGATPVLQATGRAAAAGINGAARALGGRR